MGQSAGSSSVLYHLMSPRSEGLFNQVSLNMKRSLKRKEKKAISTKEQKVIAESGSNFSPSLHSITASQAAR